MEYSKEDLMEAKKQIWGVGENMGTEESKKIWEENAQFWDNAMGDELLSFYKYPLMQYVLTIILSLVWISLKGIFISVWYKVWYSSYKKCGTAPACKNK